MLSHRYRSGSTGDEAFQDKMLADFRRFSENKEGRLTSAVEALKREVVLLHDRD